MTEKRKNFIWRHQPPINSDKAIMLNYIDERQLHPASDKSGLMLRSLIPYYMPLALYVQGNCPREKLESLLADSAIAFAHQLKYLCAVLNVDPARMGSILCGAFQISPSLDRQAPAIDAMDADLDEDDFDPDDWNLAGIATDSETFEASN